jgi:pimeloyl-ACP methyl ester carboxylesterase
MSDDSPRSSIDALLANIERMDPRALLHLAGSYVDHTARPLLRHVDVPVLVVAGEQDSLAPPDHCTAVVRELRRSQLWIAKGRTHLAPLEEPDAFVEQVDAFLASLGIER